MKYLKYIAFVVFVVPALVAADFDLVGLNGEVRVIASKNIADMEAFPRELLCEKDRLFGQAPSICTFNALVSSELGYYATVEMGGRSLHAQGLKSGGSRLAIDNSFSNFDEYDGALNALSAHTLGMGSPVLDHIVRDNYKESILGYAKDVITCGESKWFIDRYSSISFYDYLVFVKDDASFCGKSLRFSFRTFKDKDGIERGMIDIYIKEQLEVAPEISDDDLDARIVAYRNSPEFREQLNTHVRLLKSASEMIIVNRYEEGICYTPESFAEKIGGFFGF